MRLRKISKQKGTDKPFSRRSNIRRNKNNDYDTMSPVRDSVEDRADGELRAAKREERPETKRPSIREQLKEGGNSAAPERAGKPPVKER